MKRQCPNCKRKMENHICPTCEEPTKELNGGGNHAKNKES